MRLSLSERAYLAIRERILRGELALGEPLSRRSLATQLGMSVLPVNEALQRLEADRLVESRPRAGTRVRFPSSREIEESYVVREALEAQSARLFTEYATPVQRRELVRKAEHVDILFNRLAKGESDPEFQYIVHNDHAHFHLFIAESTGCELLFRLIEGNQVLIHNWLYDVAARRRALPPRFHRDLAAVLSGIRVAVSDRSIREHVRYGLKETIGNLHKPAAGDWRRSRLQAS
jgi:GntR family transcriptional regulator, rspAB operon transcriptional repressor